MNDSANLPSGIINDVRNFYEAMQRFDLLASDSLAINLTDLRCINILGMGPLTPSEIGIRVGLTSGSVTGLIDRLEKIDAIERHALTDRRSFQVALRPAFRVKAEAVYGELGGKITAALDTAGLIDDPIADATLKSVVEGVNLACARLRAI